MNITLFAYSRQGCRTARRILACFPADLTQAYCPERFTEGSLLPLPQNGSFYAECFARSDALVFVGSCGIAVRKIAPCVRDKKTDPAVVCVDEKGIFAISLLSGHIGGANALTRKIADAIGATAVVTTATDINRRFSVDAWAAQNGLVIDNMTLAKAVSAEILERSIPLSSDFPVVSDYPAGVEPGTRGDLGIRISWSTQSTFSRTLHLIPKCLHLGIGCRKGISAEAVRDAVSSVLQQHRIDLRAVKAIGSIDLKAQEAGLLQYCRDIGIQPEFYTVRQLLEVPGEFSRSSFVQTITGVDNVCERAALRGADNLIVKKCAVNGVTVAVAEEKWEVSFEQSDCCGHWPREL